MPRPDRIRQREALVGTAGAGAGDGEGGGEGPARREGGQGEGERRPTLSLRQGKIDQQRASRAPLDGGGDIDQSSRSSPTAEGELELSRKVARRLKWTDRAEWIAAGRDPAKWVDADVYLERTPQEVERLRESHSRIGAVAERALAQERENARRQAEQGVREAATSGDADAAVVAANRLAEANRPDPRTVAWAGRNPWFDKDPVAQSVAVAVVKRKAAEGASFEDQLQAAEDEVKRRFPEHGDRREEPVVDDDDRRDTRQRQDPPPREQQRETRLSDVRAPEFQAGSRTLGGRNQAPKVKGWNDIPADDRAQMKIFERNFVRKGMSQEAARQQLATGYFDNKGE